MQGGPAIMKQVSNGTYRVGDKHGVSTSAGWVRSVRSWISSMLTLMTSAPRLGEHPLVTTYVESIIKQDILDRNRPGVRYDAFFIFSDKTGPTRFAILYHCARANYCIKRVRRTRAGFRKFP
jgi:hypothetical protein